MENINFYSEPKYSDFNIDGVKHISPNTAFELLKEGKAYLIDIRTEIAAKQTYFEFQNVFNIPLSNLPYKLELIPKEILLIAICNSGFDSTKAVNFFNRQGFENAYNLDGGIIEWKKADLPIIETSFTDTSKGHSPCAGGCSGCC